MKNVRFFALLGAFALAVLPASVADAGIVFGLNNLIQFDNREEVIDNGDGTLSAGDRIKGLLQSNTINTSAGAQSPPTPEITGIFDLTASFVLAVSGNIDGIAGGTVIDPLAVADGGGGAVDGKYDGTAIVLFRPTNMTGAEGLLAGFAAGTVAALYEGGPADVQATLDDPMKSAADVFAAASDGTLVGSFGFGGGGSFDASDVDAASDWGVAGNGYWIGVVQYTAGIASPFSTFYYGLEALSGPIADVGSGPNPLNNTQLNVGGHLGSIGAGTGSATSVQLNSLGGPIMFDLVGKGAQLPNTTGAGATTSDADQAKFLVFSQDPANVHPSTPEPGSMILALLGVGCAVPFVRRRRKSQAQAA